jgi:hypothetical protein
VSTPLILVSAAQLLTGGLGKQSLQIKYHSLLEPFQNPDCTSLIGEAVVVMMQSKRAHSAQKKAAQSVRQKGVPKTPPGQNSLLLGPSMSFLTVEVIKIIGSRFSFEL